MKTKIFTPLILAIIAITTIGYSYACYNGGFQINCYCDCDIDFIKVKTWDNELEKDVGNVSAKITNCRNTIDVCIKNAYPYYEAYMNFTIKNDGCKPVHIDEVKVEEYNKTALEIEMINIIVCTWISPCEKISGLLTVYTLQEAEECHTYTFKIVIKFSCQKEHPRTIGFWKHQFACHLCKTSKSHIPADTLEQYLNQISTQSPIYEFIGTRNQRFQQALNILSPSTRSSMEAKLKAQLLALWLNYVAGWTEGWTLNGMIAWEIIQGSEDALINNRTSEYRYWKDLCDDFNNLG